MLCAAEMQAHEGILRLKTSLWDEHVLVLDFMSTIFKAVGFVRVPAVASILKLPCLLQQHHCIAVLCACLVLTASADMSYELPEPQGNHGALCC